MRNDQSHGNRIQCALRALWLAFTFALAPQGHADTFRKEVLIEPIGTPTSSEKFHHKMNQQVWPFYLATAEEFDLTTRDEVRLRVAHFEHPSPKAHLYFVTGINDSYVRNIETIYDLYELGFSVSTYDHRSQGGSARTTGNPQMVHISRFSNYVDDLSQVIAQTETDAGLPRIVVSASMGGGIVAQHIMQHPQTFSAAVFAVPMFGFKTEPYPNSFAFGLTAALCAVGRCANYAPGQTDHAGFPPFEEQTSMHSPERYQFMIDFYSERPDYLVGGKSNGWIRESLNATRQIRRFNRWPFIPTVVLSAELEDTVLNPAHESVCAAMPQCRVVNIEGAFHDLFNEADSTRQTVLHHTNSLFSSRF